MKQIFLSFTMFLTVLCFVGAQKITLQTQLKRKDKNVITGALSVKSDRITFVNTVNISAKPSLKTVFLQIAPYENLNICLGNFTFGGLLPQLKKTTFSASTAFSYATRTHPDIRAYAPGLSTSEKTPYSLLISDSFSFQNLVLNVYVGAVTKISNDGEILKEMENAPKGQCSFFSGYGIQFSKINLTVTEVFGSHFVAPKTSQNWYRTTKNFVPQRITYSALGIGYKNDFLILSNLFEVSSSPFGKPTFSSRNELSFSNSFFSMSGGLFVSMLDHILPNGSMNRKVFSTYINPYTEICLPFGINVKTGCRYTAATSYAFSRKPDKDDRADLVFETLFEKDDISVSGKLALNEACFCTGNFLMIAEDTSFAKEISFSVGNKFRKISQIYGISFLMTSFPGDASKNKELRISGNWTVKIDKMLTLYTLGTFDYIKNTEYECEGFSLKEKAVVKLFNGKTTFTIQASGSTKFNKKSNPILDFLCNAKIVM